MAAMHEVVCPRCGAVFPANAESSACPRCGQDLRSPWPKIRKFVSKWVWAGIVILPAFPWTQFPWEAWRWYARAALLALPVVLLGLVWAFLARKMRRGLRDPLASLSLNASRMPNSLAALTPSLLVKIPPPGPPAPPGDWQPLLFAPRPRQIYSAFGGLWVFVASFAGFLFTFGATWYAVMRRLETHPHRAWLAGALPVYFTLVGLIYPILARLRADISSWRLLREGEIAAGKIASQTGVSLVYEFWTHTGERFQGAGRAFAEKGSRSARGLVPVFYLAAGPSRNIALSCTDLRVKIAGEK